MAIVANLADGGMPIDPPLTTHNRTVADNPNGVTTPEFAGEIVYDSTNDCYWKAMGVGNAHWVMLTPAAP